jgi:hypothetical protein
MNTGKMACSLTKLLVGRQYLCGTLSEVHQMTHNLSIDADPQQQEAASPQMLVVRSFLR